MADHRQIVTFGAGTGEPRTVAFNAAAPTKNQSWVGILLRWLLIVIGGGAVSAVWVASAYFNVIFMIGFADLWHGKFVWGALSVAMDAIKAAMPIVMQATHARRETVAWWLALLFLIVTMPISLLAGFSYAYSSRDRAATEASYTISKRDAVAAELREARERRQMIPVHRQRSAVEAEIEDIKSDFRYARSRECTVPTLADSVELCRRYRGLTVELANIQDDAELLGKVTRLQGQLDGLARGHGSTADVQTAALSPLLGIAADVVRMFLSIFLAAVIELLATFGYLVVMTGAKALQDTYDEERAPEPVAATLEPAISPFQRGFAAWASECLAQDIAGRVPTPQAYRHYETWARFNGPYEIPSAETFGKQFARHCEALGAIRGRSGGTTAWNGVALPGKAAPLLLPRAAQ